MSEPVGQAWCSIAPQDLAFAEFEADLLKVRTREETAIARSRGRLKGEVARFTPRQRAQLMRMHALGKYVAPAERRPPGDHP